MNKITSIFTLGVNFICDRLIIVSQLKIAVPMLLSCSLMFHSVGCAVGPNYSTPKVSVPESWSELQQKGEAKPASIIQWWKAFNDPALDSLITRAVKSNLDLRVAEARVREARFQSGVVAADLWPSVNTSAS